jgi:single-stranded-DNA-specific exonuclease
VAFYVMAALRSRLRDEGWFAAGRREPQLAQLLDLVALGTVADVVPLDYNNRILVSQGLARIRAGHACAGIQAIANVAGRDLRRLSSSDLAFALAPRLNAAGRLDDMSLGIECLLCDDPVRALDMARRLDALNRERRDLEAGMQADALAILDRLDLDASGELPCGLCLFDESWHEGVVGILASRIKERCHRPVIGFAPAARADGELKGSARSVPGLHIRDVLDAVASRCPGLITRFGGHAAAAGLTLDRDKLEAFQAAFDAEVRRQVRPEQLQGTILSDGPLRADEFALEVAEALRTAGPWGQGFPEPLFDGEFEVLERRIVGERHLKMRLRDQDSGKPVEAIAFNTTDASWQRGVKRARLAYRLDVNEYRGRRAVQLLAEYLEPL